MPSPFNIRQRARLSFRPQKNDTLAQSSATAAIQSPQQLIPLISQPSLSSPSVQVTNLSTVPSTASQSTFEFELQQRLEKTLDPAAREIFKNAQQSISPEDLLTKMKAFDDAYNRNAISRRCAGTLTKVFQIINQFMNGVAIGIQASPEISSLVVGGIRLVIDIAIQFVEFFNKLTVMISRLSDYLETFALYATAAGDIKPVQNALLNAYEDIFIFCKCAHTVFVKKDGSPQKWTSTATFFRVQWQPFEARFGDIQANFKHHADVLLQSTQAVQLKSLLDVQLRLKSLISVTLISEIQNESYYVVPSIQLSQYVDRVDILDEIQAVFSIAADDVPRLKKVVLLGMGGQGKTQLALEYCRMARILKTYQATFWIDASSTTTVSRGFETIAAKISPGTAFDNIESKIDFVKETLGRWDWPWLIVFDNYDRPDEFNISAYFPHGENGAMLFTSRHAGSERLGTTIRVDRMTKEESLELLLHRSKQERNDENNTEGLKVIEKLGYLPLAIDQAGAYISQRKLPLSGFLKRYEQRKRNVLEYTPLLWEYRRKFGEERDEKLLSVFTTWELSFQQIGKSDDERVMIGSFLTTCAFLDASTSGIDGFLFEAICPLDNFPLDWMDLFTSTGLWDAEKYEKIITDLCDLSLLQIVEVGSPAPRFVLHPLVTDWLKLRKDVESRQDFAVKATHLLASYIDEKGDDTQPLRVKLSLLAHMDACLQNDKEYLHDVENLVIESQRESAFIFASYYRSLDRYSEAEAMYKRALEGNEKALGPEHTSTLQTVNNLGLLYAGQGKMAEAEAMYTRALDGREKALGPEHTSTLETVHNIGNLYAGQGKMAEAEAMYTRALEGYEKAWGPKHPDITMVERNLQRLNSHNLREVINA